MIRVISFRRRFLSYLIQPTETASWCVSGMSWAAIINYIKCMAISSTSSLIKAMVIAWIITDSISENYVKYASIIGFIRENTAGAFCCFRSHLLYKCILYVRVLCQKKVSRAETSSYIPQTDRYKCRVRAILPIWCHIFCVWCTLFLAILCPLLWKRYQFVTDMKPTNMHFW